MIFDHLFLYPWTRKLLDLHNNSLLKLFNYNCEIEYKLPVSSHVTSNDSERNYKFSLLLVQQENRYYTANVGDFCLRVIYAYAYYLTT